MPIKKYKIAISFSGLDRTLAKAIAETLAGHSVDVFYDEWEKGYLWGKNIAEELHEIYQKRAQYVLIIYSENYQKSEWANHEKRAANIQWIRQKGKEFILPIKVGNVEVEPIFEGVSYIDFENSSIDEICEFILFEKLGVPRTKVEDSSDMFARLSKGLYNCSKPLILTWDMLDMYRFEEYFELVDDLLGQAEKEGRTIILPEIRTEQRGFSLILTIDFIKTMTREDNSYVAIINAIVNSVFDRSSVASKYNEHENGSMEITLSADWYSHITFDQSFHIVGFDSGYAGSA